jgi:hypothetical protein
MESASMSTEEDDGHVCNPDDVATAELLATDTKPCPQCGTGIFKIDGCDQMWCIECRTAFSWNTGRIESGHVHNPHYFEYQRRNGTDMRNIMDMPCNAHQVDRYHGILYDLVQLSMNTISRNPVEREKRGLPPIDYSALKLKNLLTLASDYSLSLQYYAQEILPRFRPDAIQNNLELRVRYLTEQYNMDEFKHALSRETKQFNRNIEIGQVVQTVVFGMTDILTRVIATMRECRSEDGHALYCDHTHVLRMFSEIDSLIEYANECLENICKQYKLTKIVIFIRNLSKHHTYGLFTVRESNGQLIQVKQM